MCIGEKISQMRKEVIICVSVKRSHKCERR